MSEQVAEVLAAHGPSGSVNSREGWVECECEGRLFLPSGLTFDGYPEMWEEERKARDAHLAEALAPLIAERERAARAEAWDEGALWAAVECGAIGNESVPWLAAGDNPYRTTKGDE